MTTTDSVHTPRLTLVPGSLAVLDAELAGVALLGAALMAVVPADWPPGEHDRGAVEFFRAQLAAGGPAAEGWYAWYAILGAQGGEPAQLVGSAGYFGPPDDTGTLEIGYSVSTHWRRRGFATEMVRALVGRALALGTAARIVAHTRAENIASIAVLHACGFQPAASARPELLGFERRLAGA